MTSYAEMCEHAAEVLGGLTGIGPKPDAEAVSEARGNMQLLATFDLRIGTGPGGGTVFVRSRFEDEEAHGAPWEAPFIDARYLPYVGAQFLTPDDRAFAVTVVEWRYDLQEVHLFCTEYPRALAPDDAHLHAV